MRGRGSAPVQFRRRAPAVAWLATALALFAAPPALAADTFVDQSLGHDTNDCLSAGSPCATVQAGIDKAGPSDTIRVAPGVYPAPTPNPIQIAGSQSLKATGTAASTKLATLYVNGTGTVEGFTLQGDSTLDSNAAVRMSAAATLTGNIFAANDAGTPLDADLRMEYNAGSPTITQNTFAGNGAGDSSAIVANSLSSPVISDNHISGYHHGVVVVRGTPLISGNDISATYNSSNAGVGSAITVSSNEALTSPTLVGNLIHDPTNFGATDPNNPLPSGVFIVGDSNASVATASTGATLRRNRILGHATAVKVGGTDAPVTLDGDLLVGAPNGLNAFSNNAGDSFGDVTATNITVDSTSRDIVLQHTQLTLKSSIVGHAVISEGSLPHSDTCTITTSRGPTTAPGGTGCQNFQTSATPSYAGAGDYHLTPPPSNTALIDQGNAGDAHTDPFDFDADARALPGTCGGTAKPDIGADELAPACTSIDASITSGPANGSKSSSTATFGLTSSSAGTGPGFQCSLDGSTPKPCTNPKVEYGLDNGEHVFTVRATDDAGADQTPASRTWTVDATPPDTSIASGPAQGGLSGPAPGFTFSSSEAGSTFECSLDDAAFGSCSPSGLSGGSHTVLARAIDQVGNVDPIPVSRSWTVDANLPDTRIDSGPAQDSLTNRRTALLGFSSEAGATFQCALDGGAFAPCTSPRSLSGLSDGTHVFTVRARDTAGNLDPLPATRRWRVDGHPPQTTITKASVKSQTAAFRFGSSETHSRFTCRLDGGRTRSCGSPRRYTHLRAGHHTFRVYATDTAGNADRTPAKRSFTIKRRRR